MHEVFAFIERECVDRLNPVLSGLEIKTVLLCILCGGADVGVPSFVASDTGCSSPKS